MLGYELRTYVLQFFGLMNLMQKLASSNVVVKKQSKWIFNTLTCSF
jgi:uncharacterized membrane protein